MKKIIMTILLMLYISPAWATIYYVNFSTGNDSNAGTSGSPFKTMAPVSGTNFLNPGDTVHIASGTTTTGSGCTFTINSNGAPGNPINITGDGTTPIFDCSTPTSAISGWTGWTNTSGNVWESNIQVPFTIYGVIVDSSYNLIVSDGGVGGVSSFSYRYYQNNGYVYVNLPDGSNPNSHTIKFTGLSQATPGNAMISTNGNFITFTNIEAIGATTGAWQINNMDIVLNNDLSYFSGRESLYCATYYQPVGCYFSTFNNFTAEYSNGSSQQGSWGQNVTFEGSYNTFENGTIAYGGMAGFDALNYQPSTNSKMYTTPASYNSLINTSVFQNSRRSLQNGDAGGYDPQVYCDGCNNLQLINDIVKGNLVNQFNYPANDTYMNATDNIQLSTEHPTFAFPHDVYLDNVLSYNTLFFSLVTTVLTGNSTPWYNVWVVNSDIYGDSSDGGFGPASFNNWNTALGQTLHVYNSIFMQNSGSTSVINNYPFGAVDANNNVYYAAGGSTNLIHSNGTNYNLSAWASASSQDGSSLNANPYFVTAGSNFLLQRTALGQANNSPAIGAADVGYQNTLWNITSNGTTRTDSAIDTAGSDIGYHSLFTFGSFINWPKGSQIGSDIT